jgi:spore germination protein KC
MGVIKDGKLIGKLDEDQTIGYIWTEGKVNQGVTEIKCEQGAANLAVIRGKSTATPVFDGDGGIYIRIKTRTTFGISEIYGFENIKIDEVLKILKARAAEKISGYITDCFEKSISLNADIYGFGDMIRRKHPKVWKSIKDSWEQIYPSIKIQTDVDVKIANEGKITNSLIMGEK